MTQFRLAVTALVIALVITLVIALIVATSPGAAIAWGAEPF